MYSISFMHFKQCCKFRDYDYDFDKETCGHASHDVAECFTSVRLGPNRVHRHMYNRCCAKHCPELGKKG